MKILLADDHALFREGMRHVLAGLDAGATLLEASNYCETQSLIANHPDIDLALVDLRMPGFDGIGSLEQLMENTGGLPVVVLSASEDAHEIEKVLAAGAMGFIPKREASEVALGALRLVLAGGIYVPPCLIRPGPGTTARHRLSPRQQEVLGALVAGKPNKRIARELAVTEATVKAHVAAILRLLGVTNRTEAVAAARERGLL